MSHSPVRFYGRRKGRPLRATRAALIRDLLPRLTVAVPESGPCDMAALFPAMKPQALWLEIGFGGGEHLAEQALRHPDIGFIGCEPFLNGIASLLGHLAHGGQANVRIHPQDARKLLDALPEQSVDRCFVLFADPWPKKRHAGRRFIGPDNLPALARVLKPNAPLRVATDDPGLAVWMREHLTAHPSFACMRDETAPPDDWVPTRYEAKARAAGRSPVYMDWRRR